MRGRFWRWLRSQFPGHPYVTWDHCDACYAAFERVTNRLGQVKPQPQPDEWPAEMTEPHQSARRTVIRQKILAFYADADRPVASALAAAGW